MKNFKFRFRKWHIFYIIPAGMTYILLYAPVRSCTGMYRDYYRFSSVINPQKDSIFYEIKTQQTYFPETFNDQARLFYLCKTWGFLKYHNENSALYPVMDSLLIAAIPEAVHAANKTEYANVLKSFVTPVLNFNSTARHFHLNINDYILIDNQWMTDTLCLYDGIKAELDTIWVRNAVASHFAYNKNMTGNIRLRHEPAYPEFSDRTIRLLGLFRYWNVINYFYVYKNHIDKSWDKVLYESIPDFENADTEEKYHQAIYRLTNQLRDTHASYPPTIDGIVFGPYRPNFRMMFIDSTFIINEIRMPEYGEENFKVGDIVLQVDNQNIHALSDSLGQYVCGGNYWSNQSFLCNAVLSRRDSATRFMLLRDGDTLPVRSKNYRVYDMFQDERRKEKKNENKQLYKWINDSIAYFDLRSANGDNFNKNYKPIKSASAIILDLRCYPSTDLIFNLTNAFIPPNSFFAYVTYPDVRFPGMVKYHKSTSDNIGKESYFKGRIIVLVNEWTRSYSEYTAMALQANPQTVTVGNSSSGSDGNITEFEFPGGIKTVYSGVGIYYPDFTPTQRAGVRIDYVAEPTIESIKQHIDIAYEKAIEIAGQ